MNSIKIAIVGIGNCASSLIQGIEYYRNKKADESVGLMHFDLGGYLPSDIQVVAAIDIDQRKVGKPVGEAIFEKPNNTTVFCTETENHKAIVKMGAVLDGVSEHMKNVPVDRTFVVSKDKEYSKEEIVNLLKESDAEILVNYLPVGSEKATEFYAECAIDAGVGFINNIPVFIASNPVWSAKFDKAGIPLIGDDIKAQLGATITHRILTDLFRKRGVKLERTYQLNTGGNTDFLNMKNHNRLSSKKISKTEAVQSVAAERLKDENIHIGPSDYVPFQNDNKVCFLRMEGSMFGDIPMNLELRLSVEDSPNSAGVAIDTIRLMKLALDRNLGGLLYSPSSFFCKHPPKQFSDDDAMKMTEEFINGERDS